MNKTQDSASESSDADDRESGRRHRIHPLTIIRRIFGNAVFSSLTRRILFFNVAATVVLVAGVQARRNVDPFDVRMHGVGQRLCRSRRGVIAQPGAGFLPENVLPGLGLGGGVRYTGAIFGDAANTIRIPDYTLFDAFLRYDLGGAIAQGRGASLSINARNLTNKTYLSLCGGPQSCYYGSGRTVTARLQYRW